MVAQLSLTQQTEVRFLHEALGTMMSTATCQPFKLCFIGSNPVSPLVVQTLNVIFRYSLVVVYTKFSPWRRGFDSLYRILAKLAQLVEHVTVKHQSLKPNLNWFTIYCISQFICKVITRSRDRYSYFAWI
jgi:hypothetical protein